MQQSSYYLYTIALLHKALFFTSTTCFYIDGTQINKNQIIIIKKRFDYYVIKKIETHFID